MKTLTLLITTAFAAVLMATSGIASEDVHAKCCAEAAKAGKECSHPCCVEAKKEGKACEKCPPQKD